MRFLTFVCLTFFFNLCEAQTDSQLLKEGWRIGNKRITGNHEILKVLGVDVYGYTNILFMSCSDVIKELKQRATEEKWVEERLKETLSSYDSSKFGGRIMLSIGRATITSANTKWFTIIVEDVDGKQIFKKKLEESVPKMPSNGDLWSNMKSIDLNDAPLKLPVAVYIIDEYTKRNPKTQFKILK